MNDTRSRALSYLDRSTAGGPAAIDAECGLRMDATGTKRIRDAHSRRSSWKLNESRRKLFADNPRTGRRMLWASALSFDWFEGHDAGASKDVLSEIMTTAFSPLCEGAMNDDLEAVEETVFPPEVVLRHQWMRGDACVWNNKTITHSRTPAALYAHRGASPRRMLQIVQHWQSASPATLYPKSVEAKD